jgi:V/A-type H+-transporting ATPase subunit F
LPSSILIITDPNSAIGYRLAGAEVFETEDGSTAFAHLQKIVKDESIGIIGINEDLYKSINPRFLEAIKKRRKPLILSMQSALEGGKNADEYIRMMTLSTAGVIVKVEKT